MEYRGTNTTGVKVQLFLKRITCDEEIVSTKNIYPSDIDFETTALDVEIPEAGTVRIGLKTEAPPVSGRIRNFRFMEQ